MRDTYTLPCNFLFLDLHSTERSSTPEVSSKKRYCSSGWSFRRSFEQKTDPEINVIFSLGPSLVLEIACGIHPYLRVKFKSISIAHVKDIRIHSRVSPFFFKVNFYSCVRMC